MRSSPTFLRVASDDSAERHRVRIGVDVDSAMVDLPTLRLLLAALVGWLDRQQQSLLFIPHVCPDQV
jgi:hypothetical protein